MTAVKRRRHVTPKGSKRYFRSGKPFRGGGQKPNSAKTHYNPIQYHEELDRINLIHCAWIMMVCFNMTALYNGIRNDIQYDMIYYDVICVCIGCDVVYQWYEMFFLYSYTVLHCALNYIHYIL